MTNTENKTFADSVSGIRPLDCSKLAKNLKNNNDITFFWHDVNVKCFWRWFVSLVKFSCWSKFNVNIITGSGTMSISFYKGLTRNLEIGNTPVWVLPNIIDWSELWIPNLVRMSLIECCWMLQNSTVTAFTVFELLRENQLGGKITPTPSHPPRLIEPSYVFSGTTYVFFRMQFQAFFQRCCENITLLLVIDSKSRQQNLLTSGLDTRFIAFLFWNDTYNQVQNVLRRFDSWANFSFTKDETKRDY